MEIMLGKIFSEVEFSRFFTINYSPVMVGFV